MNKAQAIHAVRKKMRDGKPSVGSWMQIPHGSVAEIMGEAGYDWIAVDMEHGSISLEQLPDIFRALELGETLPLVRVAEGTAKECKQALDAGAAGIIFPNIKNPNQLELLANFCQWPPAGKRGVGYCRANLFGKNFDSYQKEALKPLLIAMIEDKDGLENIKKIVENPYLDSILIGPYDLSAALGVTGKFECKKFKLAISKILCTCRHKKVPCGIHLLKPQKRFLKKAIREGYRFIPFCTDAIFLQSQKAN